MPLAPNPGDATDTHVTDKQNACPLNRCTVASSHVLSKKIFQDISEPTSCWRQLLPEPREHSITSRLRTYEKYHRVFTRTKRYCSLIQYALNHYQNKKLSYRLGQGRRQVKICGVDRHGERGARAYNGGLEAERPPSPPPVKSRWICINFSSHLQQKWGGHVHASCQLKSCQLPRNSVETTCTTSPEQSISCAN